MNKLVEVSKYDDVIDSRDIIACIESLVSERDDWNEDTDNTITWEEENPLDAANLVTLTNIAETCESYSNDWEYGETLIRESYFTDYVEEMCIDCGYIPKDLPSWIDINWKSTAVTFAQDYITVDFDDVIYYIRNF